MQCFFVIFNNQLLFYNLIVLTLHITFKQGLIEESIFGWGDFYKCHEQNELCEFCSWWGDVIHAISTPSKGQGQDPWVKKKSNFQSVETLIMIDFLCCTSTTKGDFHATFSFSTVFATQISLKKSKLGTKISSSKSGNTANFWAILIRPCSGSFYLQFILVDGHLLKRS